MCCYYIKKYETVNSKRWQKIETMNINKDKPVFIAAFVKLHEETLCFLLAGIKAILKLQHDKNILFSIW